MQNAQLPDQLKRMLDTKITKKREGLMPEEEAKEFLAALEEHQEALQDVLAEAPFEDLRQVQVN